MIEIWVDKGWQLPAKKSEVTYYDKYVDGYWYHHTGLDIYKGGIWWGEYYCEQLRSYKLMN